MTCLHHAFWFMFHAQAGKLKQKGCDRICMSSICTVAPNFSLQEWLYHLVMNLKLKKFLKGPLDFSNGIKMIKLSLIH